MALSVRTEERRQFEPLMDELPGYMSRMKVTAVANAANPILRPGAVMGKITAGNWTIHDNAAVDGSQTLAYLAAGILLTRVESLTGEDALIVYHDATVNGHLLQFAAGMDATEQTAALATLRDTADIQIDARF